MGQKTATRKCLGRIDVAPDTPGGRGGKFSGFLQPHEYVRVWLSDTAYVEVSVNYNGVAIVKTGHHASPLMDKRAMVVRPLGPDALAITTQGQEGPAS